MTAAVNVCDACRAGRVVEGRCDGCGTPVGIVPRDFDECCAPGAVGLAAVVLTCIGAGMLLLVLGYLIAAAL